MKVRMKMLMSRSVGLASVIISLHGYPTSTQSKRSCLFATAKIKSAIEKIEFVNLLVDIAGIVTNIPQRIECVVLVISLHVNCQSIIINQLYYIALRTIQQSPIFTLIFHYTINIAPMTSNPHSPKQFETCPVNNKNTQTKAKAKLQSIRFSRNKQSRYSNHTHSHPHTIEHQFSSQHSNNKIIFEVNNTPVNKDTPGVGQYDISSPIIKPIYQTFERSNNVILVKLNHIGGTNSFCSEASRFVDSYDSITPGPGAYYRPNNKPQSLNKQTYSQNYDLIQQAFRINRQAMESIPNYTISQQKMKYNGMPRHLQEIYTQLSQPKDTIKIPALPLDRLVQLRKNAEKKLIKVSKISEMDIRGFNEAQQVMKTKKNWAEKLENNKLTQTIYRLQQQSKKQQQIANKIKAILNVDNSKRKTMSIGRQLMQSKKRRNVQVWRYNQSMVNMIFHQTKVPKKQPVSLQAN